MSFHSEHMFPLPFDLSVQNKTRIHLATRNTAITHMYKD